MGASSGQDKVISSGDSMYTHDPVSDRWLAVPMQFETVLMQRFPQIIASDAFTIHTNIC